MNSDIIRTMPATGVNVVIAAHRNGGDLLNAWDVLAAAFGYQQAKQLVMLHRDGGEQVLQAIRELEADR